MIRAAWLTYRMHRFEVLFSVVLLAVFAVWVWFISSQMLDLDIPGTCWPRDVNGDWAQPGCNDLMKEFWAISNGAGFPRTGLALLAPIVGLILGVPVVAQEIEMRTTELAWSLALRRSRWLLARLLPMLALAIVGFVVLGWLGDRLFNALDVGRQSPGLTEVASRGPTLVARGLLALGIGLLTGAIVGRTLPALVLAAIVVLIWSLIAVPTVQGQMYDGRAVWVSDTDSGWREGAPPIAYLGGGYFHTSQPGIGGEPGVRVPEDESLEPLIEAACGPYPEVYDESPEVMAYEDCNQQFWGDIQWSHVVPASTYGDFKLVDMVLSLTVGGIAILLTFVVVARRRPS